MGGFEELINKYKIDVFITSTINDQDTDYIRLRKQLEKNKINIIPAIAGQKIIYPDSKNGANFSLTFLNPFDIDIANLDINESSLVIRLETNHHSFLLTGDIGFQTENLLIDIFQPDLLQSDILKIAHHGSKNSTGSEFVDIVSPTHSIISAGQNNAYDHPHDEVLENLAESEILRTDKLGRISFIIQGNQYRIECSKTDCSNL
jgi:competence protein ComEC